MLLTRTDILKEAISGVDFLDSNLISDFFNGTHKPELDCVNRNPDLLKETRP